MDFHCLRVAVFPLSLDVKIHSFGVMYFTLRNLESTSQYIVFEAVKKNSEYIASYIARFREKTSEQSYTTYFVSKHVLQNKTSNARTYV